MSSIILGRENSKKKAETFITYIKLIKLMPKYSYYITLKINAEALWSSYDRVIIIELAHVP